jgi:hypothetical protein
MPSLFYRFKVGGRNNGTEPNLRNPVARVPPTCRSRVRIFEKNIPLAKAISRDSLSIAE